jgi:DNA-directed RNA polymerase specialized sigma24 family protein
MFDLQPKMARILARYRIPVDEAEIIVEELVSTLLLKRELISQPERWLLTSLQNRCLLYWRNQRERLCRSLDAGLLSVFAGEDVPAAEKESVRSRLGALTDRLSPTCRERIAQRYGLAPARLIAATGSDTAADGLEEHARLDDETMRCLTALSRRMLRDGLTFETSDA